MAAGNFPEYHNVYIEPGSYEIYKRHKIPEGTIFFKELNHPAGENRMVREPKPSGRGYFPGPFTAPT